jgi:hypothetical protein
VSAADHRELMSAAIERDGAAQRALFEGDAEGSREAFARASELYRRSWEAAPPASYGRLVGMLKSGVLSGAGEEQAVYALTALGDEGEGSPAAAYAHALAALVSRDDPDAVRWSDRMRSGSEAFGRTADAIAALAVGDREAYAAALAAIVRDFEQRSEHLTGIPIADTALMLERLAAHRGIAADLQSPVLPAVPATG